MVAAVQPPPSLEAMSATGVSLVMLTLKAKGEAWSHQLIDAAMEFATKGVMPKDETMQEVIRATSLVGLGTIFSVIQKMP